MLFNRNKSCSCGFVAGRMPTDCSENRDFRLSEVISDTGYFPPRNNSKHKSRITWLAPANVSSRLSCLMPIQNFFHRWVHWKHSPTYRLKRWNTVTLPVLQTYPAIQTCKLFPCFSRNLLSFYFKECILFWNTPKGFLNASWCILCLLLCFVTLPPYTSVM